MGFTVAAIKTQVDYLINAQDTELSATAREAIIKNDALQRFSLDNPDKATTDVTGNNGRYYVLVGTGTVLSSWVDGFSAIESIEYPAADIASDEVPYNYLDPSEDWRDDYQQGGKTYLVLPNHSPATTEKVRITYTLPFVVSGSPDSINIKAQDFSAYCYLSAAICCQAIATRYSRTSDSTIAADSVNHITRGQEFANRAREFMKLYLQWTGADAEQPARPEAKFLEFENGPRNPSGAKFLYHRKRR